jgi:tetratricopeptide (TPR) repeat protein
MTPRSRAWLAAGALVGLTLAAYANSFHADLTLDNRVVIGDDPRLQAVSWRNLGLILTKGYWWPTLASDLYRPLTTLTYWFNYSVLGSGPATFGYHVVNFLLHAGNALMVWRLVVRLGGRPDVAWLAAALFAVHPLGVEAVTNLVGRADLLATGGVLAAALAWLRAEAATERRIDRAWRLAMGAAALLACAAKENGVMAAAGVGLLAAARHGARTGAGRFATRALPWLFPALVFSVGLRIVMHFSVPHAGQIFVNNPIADAGFFEGTMTAVKVVGKYLALVVWPAALSCDYSYPQIPLYGGGGFEDAKAWIALAAVAGLAATGWWLRRRAWLAAGGLAWGAVMFLPVSNLLLPIGSIMGERFLYLPMTGLAVTLAIGLAESVRRLPGGAAVRWAVPAAVVLALVGRTQARNHDWRDEPALWEAARRVSPRSFNVYKGAATAITAERQDERSMDAAIALAEQGLPLLDDPPLPIERQDNTLWGDLGSFYLKKGELRRAAGDAAGATAAYLRALALLDRAYAKDRWVAEEVRRRFRERGNIAASLQDYGNVHIHRRRTLALLRLGRIPDAVGAIATWRQLEPLSVDAIEYLGRIDRDLGALDAAAVRFLTIIAIEPANETAWTELIDLFRRLGIPEGIAQRTPAGGNLNLAHPQVRLQANTALLDIVRSLRLAGRMELAAQWERTAIREFGCPIELFGDSRTSLAP